MIVAEKQDEVMTEDLVDITLWCHLCSRNIGVIVAAYVCSPNTTAPVWVNVFGNVIAESFLEHQRHPEHMAKRREHKLTD
jgi:hypothetical protein